MMASPYKRAPPTPPALVRNLLVFANRARDLVRAEERMHHGCGGLLQAMLARLDDLETRFGTSPPGESDESSWGPITVRRRGEGELSLEIRGPGADDCFSFVAGAQEEAQRVVKLVRDLDRLSAAFAKGEAQISRAHRLGENGSAAGTVVRDHIAMLQKYNEVRDVGQQLIGVIAENRGVSLGSIYRDGEFGVGPAD